MRDTREAMIALRQDAEARGLIDLAIVYGWSCIRLGDEQIRQSLEQYRHVAEAFARKVKGA